MKEKKEDVRTVMEFAVHDKGTVKQVEKKVKNSCKKVHSIKDTSVSEKKNIEKYTPTSISFLREQRKEHRNEGKQYVFVTKEKRKYIISNAGKYKEQR